jgi:hypothetical protein
MKSFGYPVLNSSAISTDDMAALFNPLIRTQYANNTVFQAPIDQQAEIIRASEALRDKLVASEKLHSEFDHA